MKNSKVQQLKALAAILPPGQQVAHMLETWQQADARYWAGKLQPCWLTAGIEAYGHCIGTWRPAARTINVIPALHAVPDAAAGVTIHEMCHQAQTELYGHLDAAQGPRGRWTDTSHRCPSWSRAVEDVIQAEGMDVFCPVWHRSTGNQWHPWVPSSSDWTTWERVAPDATFDGRQLLSFESAKRFAPGRDLSTAAQEAGLATHTAKGDPIDWDL